MPAGDYPSTNDTTGQPIHSSDLSVDAYRQTETSPSMKLDVERSVLPPGMVAESPGMVVAPARIACAECTAELFQIIVTPSGNGTVQCPVCSTVLLTIYSPTFRH